MWQKSPHSTVCAIAWIRKGKEKTASLAPCFLDTGEPCSASLALPIMTDRNTDNIDKIHPFSKLSLNSATTRNRRGASMVDTALFPCFLLSWYLEQNLHLTLNVYFESFMYPPLIHFCLCVILTQVHILLAWPRSYGLWWSWWEFTFIDFFASVSFLYNLTSFFRSVSALTSAVFSFADAFYFRKHFLRVSLSLTWKKPLLLFSF